MSQINSEAAIQETSAFDVQRIRQDFPILQEKINGKDLVYLDNGATSQKPNSVINCFSEYLSKQNGTVRRGVYHLSEQSTFLFDQSRQSVADFINADLAEIVFTRGCTESINLLASSLGGSILKPGDEVLITAMEHHANIVPWQIICQKQGASLKIAPINQNGELLLDEFKALLSPKTKIVSVTHVSNVLGTVNPIAQLATLAHGVGALLVVDGAQGIPHEEVDVKALDCDFYVFSGHKLYGPTGVGVLFGKYKLLEQMPPFMSGGDMIDKVSFEETTFALPPARFEAGTPPIVEVIALKKAIDYVKKLGLAQIKKYELELLAYASQQLQTIKGLQIIGNASSKASVVSFVIDNAHAHDLGTILDHEDNICIRVGHHCAQPLMRFFNVSATARASFAFYNTKQEIDKLVNAIHKAQSMLS